LKGQVGARSMKSILRPLDLSMFELASELVSLRPLNRPL
jgi:hypothetical protein